MLAVLIVTSGRLGCLLVEDELTRHVAEDAATRRKAEMVERIEYRSVAGIERVGFCSDCGRAGESKRADTGPEGERHDR